MLKEMEHFFMGQFSDETGGGGVNLKKFLDSGLQSLPWLV